MKRTTILSVMLIVITTTFVIFNNITPKISDDKLNTQQGLVLESQEFVKNHLGKPYVVAGSEWTTKDGLMIYGTVGEDVVKFYCAPTEKEHKMYCEHAQTNEKVFLK